MDKKLEDDDRYHFTTCTKGVEKRKTLFFFFFLKATLSFWLMITLDYAEYKDEQNKPISGLIVQSNRDRRFCKTCFAYPSPICDGYTPVDGTTPGPLFIKYRTL